MDFRCLFFICILGYTIPLFSRNANKTKSMGNVATDNHTVRIGWTTFNRNGKTESVRIFFEGEGGAPFTRNGSGKRLRFYCNPVIDCSLPDPTVIKGEDGYFYLYATENIKNVPIHRSGDLVHWEYVGTAFTDSTRPNLCAGRKSVGTGYQ